MNIAAQLWQLVEVFGALAVAVTVLAAIVRWPGFGLSVVSAFAVIHWEYPRAPGVGTLAGFDVYTDDLAIMALSGAAVVNLVRGRVRLRGIHWAALALTACLGASTLAGLASGSIGNVVVEARPMLFVALAIVWALTVAWDSEAHRLRTIRRVAVGTAIALIMAAMYHVARFGFGRVDEFIVNADGSLGQTSRPLTAAQAMMLLLMLCAVVGTATGANRRSSTVVTLLGIAAIVASQQRTVWVALAAVALVMWLRTSGANRVRALALSIVLMATIGVVVAGGWVGRAVGGAFDAAFGGGTYEGRVLGWKALLDQAYAGGPEVVVFGRPFGSGFGRYEGAGVWVEWAPHNHYLTVFLRGGILALIALVWFLVAALRRTVAIEHGGWITGAWVALAIMCWTYTLPWFLVPLATLALGMPMVTKRVDEDRGSSSLRRTKPTSVRRPALA